MSTARHSPRPSRVPDIHGGPSVLFVRGRYREEALAASLSLPFSPFLSSSFFRCFPRCLSSPSIFPSLDLFFFSLCLVLSPLIVLERVHHDCPVNHAANRSPWRRYPPTNEDLFRLVETRENTDMGMSVVLVVKIATWIQPALSQLLRWERSVWTYAAFRGYPMKSRQHRFSIVLVFLIPITIGRHIFSLTYSNIYISL